jgi:hypothetical protein
MLIYLNSPLFLFYGSNTQFKKRRKGAGKGRAGRRWTKVQAR